MSEALWQAIVTGLFTLTGVALGAIGANWQARNAAARDQEKDERHRTWSLRDFTRDRRLAVRDGRCSQAEQFVAAMTEDFHQFRSHAIWLNALDPQGPIPAELHEHAWWQKRIDKTVYQYGPVVSAISSRSQDLRAPWKRMEQAWEEMAAQYDAAYGTVVVRRSALPRPSEYAAAITTIYEKYNEALQQFITTIDKIRSSRLR